MVWLARLGGIEVALPERLGAEADESNTDRRDRTLDPDRDRRL